MKLLTRAILEHKKGPFCMMPFSTLVVDAYGDCYPCEVARGEKDFLLGNLKTESINDIWNGDKIKKIRQNMINGNRNSICDLYCHGKKEYSCKSLNHIKRFKKVQEKLDTVTPEGHSPYYPLIYLFKSSNICNLACRYCKVESSNMWGNLQDSVYGKSKKNNTLIGIGREELDKIEEHIDDIESVALFGGEPTLYKLHYDFLDKLITLNKTDINIVISTNFTSSGLNENIFDKINKFKSPIVWGSIDAYSTVNDYIRQYSDFETIEKNVKYVVNNCNNTKLYLNSVISNMNIFSIIDLHKKWYEEGLLKKDSIRYTVLDEPKIFNIKYFNDKTKKLITDTYNEYISWLDCPDSDIYPNNYTKNTDALRTNLLQYMNEVVDTNTYNEIRDKQKEYFKLFDNFLKNRPEELNYLHNDLNEN